MIPFSVYLVYNYLYIRKYILQHGFYTAERGLWETVLKNKKGQAVSLGLVTSIAIGLFILAMVMIAIIAGGSRITNSNLMGTDATAGNQSDWILSNISDAGAGFFENSETFFAILAIVIILGFIGLMIFVVTRFRGSRV